MRLFAAVVPPRGIAEDVARVVRSAKGPAPVPPRKRFMLRTTGRGAHTVGRPPNVTHVAELDTPPVEAMHLPLAGFGNVTLGDSVKLAKALRTEAATWRRPTLTFAGGAALEFPGDESVWVKVDGDLEGLMTISRSVPLLVQRLGFFVDRRQFRPWLAVGKITAATTAPYLEALVQLLENYRGQEWTIDDLALMRRPMEPNAEDTFEEMERIPLARP